MFFDARSSENSPRYLITRESFLWIRRNAQAPRKFATVIELWGHHEDRPITVHYQLGVELVAAAARYRPCEASDYTYRAAIEHLRTARDLLKRDGRLIETERQ